MESEEKIKNLDNLKIGDKISNEIVIYKDEYKIETIRERIIIYSKNKETERSFYPQIEYHINSHRNRLIEVSSILITKERYNQYLNSFKK